MPLYVYARLFFSWGFTVRPPGLSAGGPSLPVPPPSTIVGALARGLAAALGWPEVLLEAPARRGALVYSQAYRLARHLLGVGAALLAPVALHRDVVRYSTLPYQTPGNIRNPGQWFGAQNFGVALSPAGEAVFVAVFSDTVRDEGVTPEALAAAAAGIERLGARESVVHVAEAWAGEAGEARGGWTTLYAPEEAVESAGGCRYSQVTAWDPRSPRAYTRSDPFTLPELRLAVPLAPAGAPSVYLPPPSGCRLHLRSDWPAYTGDWPGDLGVVAALPRGVSG